ncbi:MAG TPA: hypothetical protein DHW02_08525, partial [Ktedonobacter sp.]|nr:hypothetical protein [Ktedonobacter sp.]
MPDTSSTGQNPFDIWTKLLENTMKMPVTSDTTNPISMTHDPDNKSLNDPWMALIDQLWRANPYSSLIPFDV